MIKVMNNATLLLINLVTILISRRLPYYVKGRMISYAFKKMPYRYKVLTMVTMLMLSSILLMVLIHMYSYIIEVLQFIGILILCICIKYISSIVLKHICALNQLFHEYTYKDVNRI